MSAVRSIRYESSVQLEEYLDENEEDYSIEEEDEDEEEEQEEELEMDIDADADEQYEHECDDVEEGYDDDDEEEAQANSNGKRGRPSASYDKAKAKGKGKGKEERIPFSRVLPVADLPDDFDGEVLDGSTYLAMANRANASLPSYTRIPLPASAALQDDRSARILPRQGEASCSRHPALPRESWTTVFPIHFRNFRARVRSSWPPDPPLTYPEHLPRLPRLNHRGEVWLYIHGHRRKLQEVKGKGKSVDHDHDDDDDAEWGIQAGDRQEPVVEMEMDDEEAAMNNAPEPVRKELEEETEKHRPHDPLVSALQIYSSNDLIHLIEMITIFITESLDRLSPFVLVPHPPISGTEARMTPNNPFPELYMRWLFASLLSIDDQLDAQGTSSLRELARAVMKVAAWRWIRAVTDKEVDADLQTWTYRPRPRARSDAGEGEKADQDRDQGQGEAGLEATLGRCWIIIHAVVAGWHQRDLLEDLDNMFK